MVKEKDQKAGERTLIYICPRCEVRKVVTLTSSVSKESEGTFGMRNPCPKCKTPMVGQKVNEAIDKLLSS